MTIIKVRVTIRYEALSSERNVIRNMFQPWHTSPEHKKLRKQISASVMVNLCVNLSGP